MILIKFVIINKIKMVKIFKTVAILEGISYIVLFANMLLVKPNNLEVYHLLLYPIGMTHGLLFIGYILLALLIRKSQNWNLINLGTVLLASLLPFATFYVERKYIKHD
jgi:integral membrane protein